MPRCPLDREQSPSQRQLGRLTAWHHGLRGLSPRLQKPQQYTAQRAIAVPECAWQPCTGSKHTQAQSMLTRSYCNSCPAKQRVHVGLVPSAYEVMHDH